MNCIVCSTDQTRIVSKRDRNGDALITRLCLGCGLVLNDPVPGDQELAAFYSRDYRRRYKGNDRPRPRQILRNFERTRRHLDRLGSIIDKRHRILDVGAGSGEFSFAMAELGKDVRGIEPNEAYADYCRSELGLNVETGILSKDSAKPDSLDLIHLSHVLEHMNRPVEQLAILASFLRDDGLLYVEVPDIFDYAATKSRGNLFHFGHIWNFSPHTLRVVAGLAGLQECEETRDQSRDSTHVFFRRGPVTKPESVKNAENAGRVSAALDRHYREGPTRRRTGLPTTRFFTGLAETWRAHRYPGPKDIGRAVLG